MRNALILHGTQGNSKENWFPWLKNELEKKGYDVWLPDLPGADKPNLNNYNEFLLNNKDFEYNKETIIVGHSSGAVAILALLSELPDNVKLSKCILVAPFEKDSPGGKWEPNEDLFNFPFNLEKAKTKADKFVFIISDNDRYCPVPYVENLAKEFDGKYVLTHGDGHFSVSGGKKYIKLPFILKYL